jgi:hypothetical protein
VECEIEFSKNTLLVRKMFPTSKDGTLFGGSVTSKSTGFGANTQSPFQSQPGSGGAFSNTFQATSHGRLLAGGTTPNQSASLSTPFSGSSTQPGGLSTPFGGAPVSTQPSASAETTRTLQLVEKLTADLATLTQKLDAAVAAAQAKPVDRVYVACSLHPHVLLETTASGTEYAAGYTCDICQVTYQNKEERFYQCASCPSPTGRGKFDVCVACVKKQLAIG